MKRLIIICLAISSIHSIHAQKINNKYKLEIKKTSSPVNIDGIDNDEAWKGSPISTNFNMVLPMDTSKARVKTEVKLTYDKKNLYVLAHCYKNKPGANMVESLRRDFNFVKNDNFIIFFDTFDDLTNGLAFGVNAAGAQWDGILFEGGKADLNWDNKWNSVVKDYSDRWTFEAAIPFKTLRYKKGVTEWGVNLSRNDLKGPEKSTWAPVPRQFPTASLAYTGVMVWDSTPPPPGPNVSIIPYTAGSLQSDYLNTKPSIFHSDFGGDIKVGITSSLNMDMTFNPDFSQVEVDRQVTNLDRFELFFPERRQFFLENGDLFANFGYTTIRPFFSRRIGLESPILTGARLSGKINKDWRIGLLNMQSRENVLNGLPGQNFTVVALQRRLFKRSNLGFIAINKQSPIDFTDTLPGKKINPYNRNFGMEYNLASSNNKWTGKALLLKSFSPGSTGKDWVHAANIQYNGKKLLAGWQHEWVGSKYNAEVGYVPRKGYIKMNPTAQYLFFPKSGKILSHGLKINSTYFFQETGKHIDDESYLPYTITFRNNTSFTTWIATNYVYLTMPFDPTNSGKDTLSRGSQHHWKAFGTEFISRPQKVFTYSFTTRFGGYYLNGSRSNVTAEINYRMQPYAVFSLAASYNDIRMPAPWNSTKLWLISPRIDITATNNLYFTTFIQYNNQLKNLNINSRLQWRYRPASDIFLVYTDNYIPFPFKVKNRGIVLKITYWWNT